MGLSFGFQVIGYLLLAYFGGTWVDEKFQSTPIGLITALFLAIILIFRGFWEMSKVLEHSALLEEKIQREQITKEEEYQRKVEAAKESLSTAHEILSDFEEMVAEKERAALARIRGEEDEDPNIDSRSKIKKF